MIKIWKNKANNKNITRSDMVAYCILRSIKWNVPVETLLHKAFTPGRIASHRPTPYHAIHVALGELRGEILFRKTILGSKELYEEFYNDQFKEVMKSI